MAAGRLLLPSWMPALDGDGFPIPNAKVYFYLNLTTTLAPVYANEALTTPLANPVEANSSGRFPAVWADGDALYSASVEAPYGPAGVPFTYDNLSASLGADILIAGAAETAANEAAQSLIDIEQAIQAAQDADGVAAVAGAIAGQAAGEAAAEAVVAGKLDRVSTMAQLAALPSNKSPVYVLSRAVIGDRYAGVFTWRAGNQSANVTSDPGEGVWVAPASDASGASGAWQRVYRGPVLLDWFSGVDPTGVTSSHVGLQRAFNAGFPLYAGSKGAVYVVSADNLSIPSDITIEDMRIRRRGYNEGWLLKNSTAGLTQDNENITLRRCQFEDDGLTTGRGNMLKMDGVKRLTIEDCSVFTSSPPTGVIGAWSAFIAGEDIRISGWTVDSQGTGLYGDGMHFGQVRRMVMTDFHIQAGDDAIALHFPPASYGYLGEASRDIVIGNGYVSSTDANGIRIGAYGGASVTDPDARWENVLFHDITFGPCKGCLSINDNRAPAEITSKNTGIVFDGMNFGDQANTRLIFIGGNPNTGVAGNYLQHNFRDITLRNIEGRQSLGQLLQGGGADRLVIENASLSKDPAAPVTATPDLWVQQVDETSIKSSHVLTSDTGSAIRFQLCRDVTIEASGITGGASNPFALIVVDRPAEFNGKFRMFGGSVSGGQRLFNGTGAGTLDEFIVQGTYLSNFTVSDTSILAATTYRFNPSGQVMAGNGSPEGVITATRGAIWQRRDGAATTSVYYKNTGSGNTGWVALFGPISGTTAARPTGVAVGTPYYDTTLGKPVWFKSTGVWVDATGATV